MAVFDDLIAYANPVLIERDIHLQQGASWEIRQPLSVNGTPMDFSGCSAFCQVRTRAGAMVFTFTSITLATGLLTLQAAPSATASLVPGIYVYDVDVLNSTSRRLTMMAGNFRIAAQVTT